MFSGPAPAPHPFTAHFLFVYSQPTRWWASPRPTRRPPRWRRACGPSTSSPSRVRGVLTGNFTVTKLNFTPPSSDHPHTTQSHRNRATPTESLPTNAMQCAGQLRLRKDPNPKLPTGAVELLATSVRVLNGVGRLLPFSVSEGEEGDPPREELRLKNRVLDLRWVVGTGGGGWRL
jgi:hypothetical protein